VGANDWASRVQFGARESEDLFVMMRLRQAVLAARHLEPTRQSLFSILGLTEDFKDPGVGEFGIENSVMAIGDTFLEVVSPVKEDTATERFIARRGGDCGYMVIVQVDDAAAHRAHIDRLGVRTVWETEREQVTAYHCHPKDVGGAILSFDQMTPPESWLWGGPEWEQHPAANVSTILAVDIQSPDPNAMAARWSEVFDRPVDDNTLELDRGIIRFVPETDGRGAGIAAVDLATRDADAAIAAAHRLNIPVDNNSIQICGTTIRLR
jgi:hypothetical protein